MIHILKYLFFSFLILISTSIFSQDVIARLDLGKKDPKPDYYEYSPVDGGLITLGATSTASNRNLGLVKYNSNLEEVWKKKVLVQNGRKNIDFVSVIGPNIFVFVSEFFPKEKVIKTYYYAYDLDGKELADEAILSVYPNQKEQKVDLKYVLSPNKRKLLCYKNLRKNRDSEEILYYIFDDEGDLVQNGEISLKYPDNRFQIVNIRVSNSGNIYTLGKFYRSTNVKEAYDFKYLVYAYDISTETGREVPIELGDRYITNLAFRLDRQDNIYVAGFYSNRSTDQITGTILQKIEPDGTISINANEAFDPSFMSNYLSNNQIRKGRELQNFYLDSEDGIVLRSDGGVLLIAEKFYVTYESVRDRLGYYIDREIYHYEDVILTSVNAEGNIEWHSIVDKNQQGSSPANLSYFNAISGMGAYIFYEYRPQRGENNIYFNTVGIEGRVSERIPLLNEYSFSNQFFPRYSEQINNKEALMVYLKDRGKTLSVIKVRLEP